MPDSLWFPKSEWRWFFEYGQRWTGDAHAANDRRQALCDTRIYVPPFEWPGWSRYDLVRTQAQLCGRCVLIITNYEKDMP